MSFTSDNWDALEIHLDSLSPELQQLFANTTNFDVSIALNNFRRDNGQRTDFRVIYSYTHTYALSNAANEVPGTDPT